MYGFCHDKDIIERVTECPPNSVRNLAILAQPERTHGRASAGRAARGGGSTLGEKRPNSATALECWRPRRDLNPCYRRERDSSNRNILKTGDTGGAVRRFRSTQIQLLDHNWTMKSSGRC
jgi:hypothetical protein